MPDYSKRQRKSLRGVVDILEARDGGDPKRIRYGCFLPDLTGLASASSTAGSREPI